MLFDDRVDRYEQDGFLIIPDLITDEECDQLKLEAQKVFNNHAKPNASVYVHASVVSPVFCQFHQHPRLLDVLKKLMPNGVAFLSDKVVVKTADKTFATPWHMDCFYWPGTRSKLSVWIPFVDANADNGTLTVVRGSHTKEWTMIQRGLSNGEFLFEVADNEINPDDIVVCTVKRGSGIFFSDRLVHGSTTNTACTDRFTIINTYHAPADDEPFDLDFPARRVLV